MMKYRTRTLVVAAFLALMGASGCAQGTDLADVQGEVGQESLRDESFLQRASQMGMDANDPRTTGILKVANEASVLTLDRSDEVGLDVRAARNIGKYRDGDDAQSGTGDDRTFETLEQLDGVSWVGQRAFGKLYEYADANGYIPEEPTAAEPVHGITPESPRANGVLRVANEASFATLDETEQVGLDRRAASNIVAYRAQGDRTFDTLEALDAVSYVSSRAFSKLLEWAELQGYVQLAVNRITVGDERVEVRGALADQLMALIETMDADKQALFDCAQTADRCEFRAEITHAIEDPEADVLVKFKSLTDGSAVHALAEAAEHQQAENTVSGRAFRCEMRTYSTQSGYHFDGASCSVRKQRVVTLDATDTVVPTLGESLQWEGWLIVDGQPVSTGLFDAVEGRSSYQFAVDAAHAAQAAKFVLTIEPADQPAGTPSASKYLAGDLQGGMATLSTSNGPALSGADVSTFGGQFFLAAPSAGDADQATYRNGIWAIDISGGSPAAGLDVPELGDGWTYEGWVVRPGEPPVSTGRFDRPDGRDSDAGGPAAGPNGTPPFPGQDFVADGGRRELTDGYKFVLTVEPQPDNAPTPFAVKPLAADITDAGAKVAQQLQLNDAGIPIAGVSIE